MIEFAIQNFSESNESDLGIAMLQMAMRGRHDLMLSLLRSGAKFDQQEQSNAVDSPFTL